VNHAKPHKLSLASNCWRREKVRRWDVRSDGRSTEGLGFWGRKRGKNFFFCKN